MPRKLPARALALALVTLAALAACTGRSARPAAGQAPVAPGTRGAARAGIPAFGGSVTLVLEQDPDNLNPIYFATASGAHVSDLIFDGLTYIDQNLGAAPRLARSWEVNADGTEWTFHLREDAAFHDNQPVTADDVVFTYKVMMDPNYTGPRVEAVAPLRDVIAVVPHAVKFILKEPYAPFLLTATQFGILPRHLLKDTPVKDLERAPFNQHPIGSGPYRFVAWKSGQYIELRANENWALRKEGQGPWIETIRWRIVRDPAGQVAALESGQVDALYQVDPIYAARLKQEKKDTFVPYDWDRMGFGYIALNVTRPPLDDRRVRQALSYGLNRQAIVHGVLNDQARVPPGPIPPVSWAYDPNARGYPYDPQKAAQLLQEAGFTRDPAGRLVRDGKPLVIKLFGSSGNPVTEGVGLQARKDWGALGIQVDLEFMEFNTLMQNYVMPGKFDASFSGFSLDVDPDSLFALYHSSAGRPDAQGLVRGFNRSRYSNPEVDRLLEEARREQNRDGRRALYGQVQRLIIDDAPSIWVYSNVLTDFANRRVKGVVNTPGYGIQLFPWRWYVEEQ